VIYGTLPFWQKIEQHLFDIFGTVDWPYCWIPANSKKGNEANGIYLSAITGPLHRVEHEGKVVATVYTIGTADICLINGLQPAGSDLQSEQTLGLLESMQSILQTNGFDMTDIVRTWFYNDDILSWYAEFNRVRTGFYKQTGLYDHRIPASTGVGIFHPENKACIAHVLAIKPTTEAVSIETVESPLQCSATRYGSSFSRAAIVKYAGASRLYVSGTASINNEGKTIYLDDLQGQIKQTYKVVEEILTSCQMSYANIVSGVIYFARHRDIAIFNQMIEQQQIPVFPAVFSENVVCRGDLLFEIEVEALK
jgi:enamine deaminase RidA (YjgF/YER057c/UK114 family)